MKPRWIYYTVTTQQQQHHQGAAWLRYMGSMKSAARAQFSLRDGHAIRAILARATLGGTAGGLSGKYVGRMC